MEVRFHNFETAALHVAYMRSEGYLAWICNEQSSLLYGPLAMGGCSVIQSDTPVEVVDGESLPEEPSQYPDSRWLWSLRIVALLLAGLALVLMLLPLVTLGWQAPGRLLILAVQCSLVGLMAACAGLAMGMMGRFLALDPLQTARWRLLLLWPLVLLLLAAFVIAPS